MMNISRADALEMSLWEYESRLWHWNDAHSSSGGDIAGPDRETTQRLIDLANSNPALTH